MATLKARLANLEAHQAPSSDACACPVRLFALDYRRAIAALAPPAAGGPVSDDEAREAQRCDACGRLPSVLIMPLRFQGEGAHGQP